MNIIKNLLIVIILVAIVSILGYSVYNSSLFMGKPQTKSDKQLVIGLSLGTLKEERWQKDRDFFVKKAESLGAKVTVVSANADVNLQKSQIESLILQKVDVLVIVPQDDKTIAPLVAEARQKGIKVIAYDRIVAGVDLDGYVTVDYVKAGMQQAQAVLDSAKKGNFAVVMGDANDSTVAMQKEGIHKVLDPEVKKGNVKIVYEDFTSDWKPEVAYEHAKAFLAKNPDITGIVSMNDGMASGIIKALTEAGLSGKVAVSGMDAELAGCQRIVEGKQTQTSYLPINLQAEAAAQIAVSLASGQKADFNGKTDNRGYSIQTYFVQPVSVNKDNMMDTIVKDGFHTEKEVYRNVQK